MDTHANYQLSFNIIVNKYCTVPAICNQLTTKYYTVHRTYFNINT